MGQIIDTLCSACRGQTSDDLSNKIKLNGTRESIIAYGTPPPIDKVQYQKLLDNLPLPLRNFELLAKKKFHKEYELKGFLGEGAFASVYECVHKNMYYNETFAVKITKKGSLDANRLYCTLMGPNLLQRMYHRNILRFMNFYKDDDNYYMVCEKLVGGPILDVIEHAEKYQEYDICRMVYMFLEGLEYIHARNVVHRDLKLENILSTASNCKTQCDVKIVDFGLAEEITDEKPLTQMVGTPGYMAPEVVQRKPYGKPADIWSAGVIIYTLLCGYPPFHHDYVEEVDRLFRIICAGFYMFDSPYWDDISDNAKDVIKKMLVLEPEKRSTATELLHHEWFRQLKDRPLSPTLTTNLLSVLPQIQRFNRVLKKHVAARKNKDKEIDFNKMVDKKLAEAPLKKVPIDLRDSILLTERGELMQILRQHNDTSSVTNG